MQIQKLEQKLAELHATDVKALDRAYQSQCQHVDALQLESTVCAPYSAGISPPQALLQRPTCMSIAHRSLHVLTLQLHHRAC